MRGILPILLALVPGLSFSQAFSNLDFEEANTSNPDSLHRVPFTNAFPNWQASGIAYSQGVSEGLHGYAYHNSSDLDQITLGIYDRNAIVFEPHPVLGTYTAYIEMDLGSVRSAFAQLTQTGFIPVDAKSILFTTTSYSTLAGFSAQLTLSLGAQGNVPYFPLDVEPTYTIWGADISASAGTTSQLGFYVSASYPFAGADPHVIVGIGLDDIGFSPSTIPEPATPMILAAGLVCLGMSRLWK